MRTTVELPEDLLNEVKVRAAHDGREWTETVADLLRKGLAAEALGSSELPGLSIQRHPRTGLPVIDCPFAAPDEMEATPDRVTDVLLRQEKEWGLAAGG